MKKNYKKIVLLFTHISFASVLIFFTIVAIKDYNRNVILGTLVSLTILTLYFFILKKSLHFFKQERIGLAYFLTIGGFLSLMFIQMVNCSNSYSFLLH